ncbi:suppressor of fused domain protein [Clostridium paraputrificum]|uniref:suppressor of fused domain protein n=1 Tax=Clostridium TaxID=1485 RepID=UPI003D33A5E8
METTLKYSMYLEDGHPTFKFNKNNPIPTLLSNVEYNLIENHLEKYLGKVGGVYHEHISEIMHLDIIYFMPTKERPYYTFVTAGMSSIPMNIPANTKEDKYAELVITLPANWKIGEEDLKDIKNYWPIQLLKDIARYPFKNKSWLGPCHTIDNESDEELNLYNNSFSGVILFPNFTLDPEFSKIFINKNKTIKLHSLVPLYKEEINFKIDNGSEPLFNKFISKNINEVINLNRLNTCNKKKGLFSIFYR